jgi:hypothetical protein
MLKLYLLFKRKLSFTNRGLDAIKLGNVLLHKSVKSKTSPYFEICFYILNAYTTPRYSTTNMHCKILAFTTLSLNPMVTPVHVFLIHI